VQPVVRSIGRITTIGAGEDRVELRPARGQQSSSMLLVYLPAQRLLYASDVVLPDTFEPVFAAGYWASWGGSLGARGCPSSACSPSICRRRRGGIALASGETGSPGEPRRGA
jgi:hypothetical protein